MERTSVCHGHGDMISITEVWRNYEFYLWIEKVSNKKGNEKKFITEPIT